MSQEFFNRTAELIIGKPNSGKTLNVALSIKTPMRISFELSKTWISLANIGTVTVNNLSTATRNMIRQDRKLIAILKAGYADLGGPQMIFHGDIVDVSHNIEKPEIATTITIMDGHNAIKESKVSVSYAKGTPLSKIIKNAVAALGLPVNASFQYVQLPQQNLDGSLAYSGNAATWLDRLCEQNGLKWSVQNGSVKIYSLAQTDNVPPLKTVMIGSPKRLFKNQLSMSLEDFSGYEFNCLLAPAMEPNNRVTIQSNEITKPITLEVCEVKHKGDTHGEDWKTNVKAKDL